MHSRFIRHDMLRAASTEELLKQIYGDKAKEVLIQYSGSLRAFVENLSASSDPADHILLVAHEIIRRALLEEMRVSECLASTSKVKEYLRAHFVGCTEERHIALWLDCEKRLLDVEDLFRGTQREVRLYHREILRHALGCNAAYVIFAHNHFGDATPSWSDRMAHSALISTLDIIKVRVVDNFVVGETDIVSISFPNCEDSTPIRIPLGIP